MSEETKYDTRRKVTSVGNSWVVCNSRSHPGYVFYFNSLTGEAVWNLSDAEIEKAKSRTKRLEQLPGAKPVNCSEPKQQPPLKNNSETLQSPSKKKPPNTELKNNSEPVQLPSKENPPSAQLKNNLEPLQEKPSHTQLKNNSEPLQLPSKEKPPSAQLKNNSEPLQEKPPRTQSKKNSEPLQSLSSKKFRNNKNTEQQSSDLMYSNITNSFSLCTPLMQGTHLNNPAAIEPIFNFNSYNSPLNTYVLNTAPMVYNPKIWDIPQTQQLFIPHAGNVAYNQTVPQPVTTHNINSFKQQNDLRKKLTFNKRNFHTKSSILGGSGFFKTNPKTAEIPANFVNNKDEGTSKDSSAGMESKCLQAELNRTSSRIDLGPLKSLAPSNSNSDAWFIAVDLEVLLHEFKFLNTLTDSDEKCYLLVPRQVMEELKRYVTLTKSIQAKRILRFLSQQIETGFTYMADEPSEVEGDSIAEVILSTCKEILDNNYHLILLTNDNELLTKSCRVKNIFSVDKIKKLLTEIPNKQLVSPGPKKPYMCDDFINKIKITVPNNALKKDTTAPVRDNQSDDHIDKIPITPPIREKTPDKTEQLTILKKTVDAGIQTDLGDVNACISIMNVEEKQRLNLDSNLPPQNRKEAVTGPPVSIVSNIPDKKREIKLKRSLSHQPSVNSAVCEKKKFRWRRKTNTFLQVNKEILSHNDQSMNEKNVESLQTNTLNNEKSKISDKTLNNNVTLECAENKILNDSMESGESSIYTKPRHSTIKENITIEETSTSDMISNTESNVDADSTCSNLINKQSVYYEQSNKAMYEVESITMEQYLKTKCDEWISRFIQIMEEVLTQVLQKDPTFADNGLPPPWTLHEATQCVFIKYCGIENIITAAKNLLKILFEVRDAKGQISMNMTPYQYMKMYSYGVHLLDAIKGTDNCEDIQIAMESLNELLRDIKNPNMDNCTNDIFDDNKVNNISNNDLSAVSDMPKDSDETSMHDEEILSDCNHAKDVPKDKTTTEKGTDNDFIKKITKLSKLDEIRSREKKLSCEDQHLTHSQIRQGNNPQNANEPTEKGMSSDVPNYKTNVVRKFTKVPKLEEKLSREKNLYREEQHLTHSQMRHGYNPQNTNETTEKGTEDDVIKKNTTCSKLGEKLSLEEKLSRKDQHLTHSQIREGNNAQNAIELTKKGMESDVSTYKTNVIRKFTKVPMLEQKLSREKKLSCKEQHLTYSQMRQGNNPQNANETTEKGTEGDVIKKITKCSKLDEQIFREDPHLTHSQIKEGNNAQNANETTEKGIDSDVPNNKPNVIRKFTKVPNLEEKLSRKRKLSLGKKLYREDKLSAKEKPLREEKIPLAEKISGEENLSGEEILSLEEKLSPPEQQLTYSQIREGSNPQNVTTGKVIDSHVPTVIRKFTIFPELEEKLKSNYNLQVYEDFDSDYNESYDDYVTGDYCSHNENYDEQSLDSIDIKTDVQAITNEAYEPEETVTNEALEPINLEDDSHLSDENSKKFKYMMCMLLLEIRSALNKVRVFCDQCYKELKNPEESTEPKYELRRRAERAHLHTLRLCRSLESMLDNETNNPTKSMSDYLEEADIKISHVDANLLLEYRITVAKCKDHAGEFLSSIRNIISEMKR